MYSFTVQCPCTVLCFDFSYICVCPYSLQHRHTQTHEKRYFYCCRGWAPGIKNRRRCCVGQGRRSSKNNGTLPQRAGRHLAWRKVTRSRLAERHPCRREIISRGHPARLRSAIVKMSSFVTGGDSVSVEKKYSEVGDQDNPLE